LEGEAQDSYHLWEEEDQPTRPQEDPTAGIREARKRDAQQVAEGEKQDFLEGLHPLGEKPRILWRGQPLPKQKKKLHIELEPVL
jgi:hypothetical protein